MKVLIFSHESDIDGIGNIILAKLAFDEIDYVLVPNVKTLEERFREYLESSKLDEYDRIYITDLSLYNPSLDLVAGNVSLSSKTFVFDHHKFAIEDGCGEYSFTNIKEKNERGQATCGTELFYQHLVENGYLKSNLLLKEFVELTRLEDTWEWKNSDKGVKAHDLAILFNKIGIDSYIRSLLQKLNSTETSIEFNLEETNIIESEKEAFNTELKQIFSRIEYFIDSDGNSYGMVVAEYKYRNELAEYVRSLGKINIKYLIIVAYDKGENGQMSYRSIEKGFDVNEVAKKLGGGGHKEAASVNIPKEGKRKALELLSGNN